jgi:flavin reductase (NADH)
VSHGSVVAEPADLRALMKTSPSSVAIVTSLAPDGKPWGMTCTSMCSVTLEPPTLLVCLREGSPTLAAVLASGSFTLNLLREESSGAAELFASARPDRFQQVSWSMEGAVSGPHLAKDAHTVADCRVVRDDLIGDHRVIFGQVVKVRFLTEPRPLLHGFRRYGRWSER